MILQGGKAGGGSSGGNTIYTGNGTLSGNRTVDLDGHTLTFSDGGLSIDASTNTTYGNCISLDSNDGSWAVGDLGLNSNKTILTLDDSTKSLIFTSSVGGVVGTYFSLDVANQSYKIGDISAQNNGLLIELNDSAGRIIIDNAAHNSFIQINGTNGFSGSGAYTNFTINGGIITSAS